MPYLLTAFDAVALPRAMPVDDLSTGPVESTIENSIGGSYDYAGASRRLPRRHEFTHKGIYEGNLGGLSLERVTPQGDTRVTTSGDIRVIESTTFANLQEQTDQLKAKIGVRGQLWRQRINDGAMQWKRCRLLQVKHVEEVEQAGVISKVESRFETIQVGWKVQAATLTNDVTPASLNIINSGLLPVYDGILRVSRTGGTITQVNVSGSGIDITWTGSLGVGQTLTIDSGLQTVHVGNTDAYSGFVLGAPHTSPYWLPLSVGLNALIVTATGGTATVQFEHYNQYP